MDLVKYSQLVRQAMNRSANQRYEELWHAGLVLLYDPPQRVLEIGTASGGSFWFWKQLATEDAELMTIDVTHHDVHEDCRYQRGRQAERWLLGDSRDLESRRAAAEFFTGPIDFLFIDGNHSLPAVRSDFSLYAGLVRPGGWIAFHDIATDGEGVPDFWRDHVKSVYPENVEFNLETKDMGIGMVRWRP